jgi:hypothetical protein
MSVRIVKQWICTRFAHSFSIVHIESDRRTVGNKQQLQGAPNNLASTGSL